MRRAEAFYALVAEHEGGETGIAGITWAGNALSASDGGGVINFSEASDPGSETKYLKQAWGAFGAAYGSQLYEIDVFAESADHEIPVPSSDVGDVLADAFAESIGDIAPEWFAVLQSGSVSARGLERFTAGLPSRIPADSTERSVYEALLFNQLGLDKTGHEERRKTLLLILSISKQLGRTPTVNEIRWVLYSGCIPDGAEFVQFSETQQKHSTKWRVYQANDLLHVAYEALLKFGLEVLGTHPAGMRFEGLVDECLSRLSEVHENPDDRWSRFVESVDVRNPNVDAEKCSELLYFSDEKRIGGPAMAVGALEMLAILLKRTESIRTEIGAAFGILDSNTFRSLASELEFLDQLNDASVAQVARRLLSDRVFKRHMWVAMRKLRHQKDYTFLFDSDEGRLRLRATDGPVLTNPRLGPAITFLHDLALVDDRGLTPAGRGVLVDL